eukprot:6216314-Lingulodinium_polyedra.AAC.1
MISIGWQPVAPHVWKDPEGEKWEFIGRLHREFLDYVRETAERRVWAKAALHRNGEGLEQGFDVLSATKAMGTLRCEQLDLDVTLDAMKGMG